MAKLPNGDARVIKAYEMAEPDPLGDLHQRMKALIEIAKNENISKVSNKLWHAIWDLQTEVSHYTPERPPFGRR